MTTSIIAASGAASGPQVGSPRQPYNMYVCQTYTSHILNIILLSDI